MRFRILGLGFRVFDLGLRFDLVISVVLPPNGQRPTWFAYTYGTWAGVPQSGFRDYGFLNPKPRKP